MTLTTIPGLVSQWLSLHPEADLGDSWLLAKKIVHDLEADMDFEQHLEAIAINQVRAYLRKRRAGEKEQHIRRTTEKIKLATAAPKIDLRWRGWTEQVGNLQLTLLTMTKYQLSIVADEHKAKGKEETRIANLFRLLSDSLAPDQKVGDKYTVQRIEELYRSLEGEAA